MLQIGKTGRCFEVVRKNISGRSKHVHNGSNIAKHVCSFEQRIAFDNSSVIDKGSFRICRTSCMENEWKNRTNFETLRKISNYVASAF